MRPRPPRRHRRPARPRGNPTPLLWIASNGHLDGWGGLNTSFAMSSPAAVNNGAWHQAVLVPGQALYVDGVKVATGTLGYSPPASAYALPDRYWSTFVDDMEMRDLSTEEVMAAEFG